MKFPDAFQSGMIFEIPLINNYGFGYVKMIVKSIPFQISRIEDQVFLKPYNLFSKVSLEKNVDLSIFCSDDLIFPPQLLAFRPSKKGRNKWTYLGMSKVTIEDGIVPDFRELSNMANPKEYHRIWGYGIQRFSPNYSRFFVEDLKLINHLSYWQHFHPIRFNYLLTTFWIITNADNLKDIFLSTEPNYDMVQDSKKLIDSTKAFKTMEKLKRFRTIE